MIRRYRHSDLDQLKEIHARAGYGFDLPDFAGLAVSRIIEDPEGNVVGLAGAQLEAQIFGVFDPRWGAPGERMQVFAALHRPIAEKLDEKGVKEAYVAVDPSFPAFGRRLLSLGWKKALWTHYFLRVEECLQKFGGRMAS